MADISEINNDDVMKILLATDIHLGCNENDRIRGEDSFNTFEEILSIAKDQNVDFLLLGGDLLHFSKPTTSTILKCTTLLRKYCLGDKPITMQIIPDQSLHHSIDSFNFEDPNQNISLPVFSIHGNHDDPIGVANVSSLDLFSAMGLVNYFGKTLQTSSVEVEPIQLIKGQTRIALYGLSHIKDQRLIKMIEESRVSFLSFDTDEWFSILVVHQNRADRGPKTFLPEDALPGFIDFILWGHEHDCRIEPELTVENNIYICQPGSSVATSLAEGEAGMKYVAMMEVYKKSFKLNKIRLKTVRPFIFKTLTCSSCNLDAYSDIKIHEQVERIAKYKVEEMILESKKLLTGHPKQPTLPLIRLRIGYDSENQLFNTTRAGQMFDEQVANSADLITLFKNFKTQRSKLDKKLLKDPSTFTEIETYVEDFFKNPDLPEEKKMKFLSVKGLCRAAKSFIDNRDYTAIEDVINYQCNKLINTILEMDNLEDADITDKVKELCETQLLKENEIEDEIKKLLNNPKRFSHRKNNSEEEKESDNEEILKDSDDELEVAPKKSVRGKGTGKGRRGGRAVKTDSTKTKKTQSKKEKLTQNQSSLYNYLKQKKRTDVNESEEDNEISIIDFSSDEEIAKEKKQKSRMKETKQKKGTNVISNRKQSKVSVYQMSSDSD